MKRFQKRTAVFLAIISIVTMCNFYSSAVESDSIYEEIHDQINIKYTTLEAENDTLSVKVDNKNFIYRYFGNKEKSEIDALFERYPDAKAALVEKIQLNENVCAISYTEAPIYINEGHLERVRKENEPSLVARIFSGLFPTAKAAQVVESDKPTQGGDEQNFSLFTFVSKQSNGDINTCTMGTWEKGSWTGGNNYPASGYDYLYVTSPGSFTRYSHDVSCLYTESSDNELKNSYNGREGNEYLIEDGNENYLEVRLKDDPLGLSRLSMVVLNTYNHVRPVSDWRMVHSHYVHTWISMKVDVTVAGSTEKSVTLSLKPQFVSKSWKVVNYVTFNF